jgi:mRNA-degrading endonuclease RelE of RelBE toxin-antitoxin system
LTSGGYEVRLNNSVLAGWKKLEEYYPEEMKALLVLLRTEPDNLRITNGKTKKLKGRLREYLQYDVSFSDRVRYTINKKRRLVLVEYAGPHP